MGFSSKDLVVGLAPLLALWLIACSQQSIPQNTSSAVPYVDHSPSTSTTAIPKSPPAATAPPSTPSSLPSVPVESTITRLPLQVISVSSPVRAGANATLTAQTTPGANCTITVYYKSGRSTAAGLISKTADSGGRVSWTWKVGSNTTSGSWRIVVDAIFNGETTSQTTYFTVR